MTLTLYLNYFNFDYCLYDDGNNKSIGLIDEQGVNLGSIEEDRFENSSSGILSIIERLSTYYDDYIFNGLRETLLIEFNIDTSQMNWSELYETIKKLNLDYDMDIMPYIFGDKKLILDSDTKEIYKEYLNEEQEEDFDLVI